MNLTLIIWLLQYGSEESGSDGYSWWSYLVPLVMAALAALSRMRSGPSPGEDRGLASHFDAGALRGGPAGRSMPGSTVLRPRQIVPEVPSFDEALADANAGLTPDQARSRRIAAAGQSIETENDRLLNSWHALDRALQKLVETQSGATEHGNTEGGWQIAGPLSVSLDISEPEFPAGPPYALDEAEQAWQAALEGPEGPLELHRQALLEMQRLQQERKLRGAALTLPGPLETVSQVLKHAREAVSPELQPASRARLRALVQRFAATELPRICDNLRFGSQAPGL